MPPSLFSLVNLGCFQFSFLKGQGQVVNKPVISAIYIVAHIWSFMCSVQILVDGVGESTIMLLLKIHQ